MLTLNPDSACDVCAEEYGPFNLPRCIPCGHVLCEQCATTIVDKTAQRSQPACPFCREIFTSDSIRVIRIDFSQSSGGGSSGPSSSTPNVLRSFGGPIIEDEMVLYDVRSPRSPITSARNSRHPSRATSRERGIFKAIDEDRQPQSFDLSKLDVGRHKERAAELQKKVAKIATKRCNAEEVQALQSELAEWMNVDKMIQGADPQHLSIQLSNLLLRAILMNHVAHSEATRVAKGAEQTLRSRLADGELIREKLDSDLRRHKNMLASKAHEINNLKLEITRLNGGAVTPTRRQSMSAPTSPEIGYFSFSTASTAVPPSSSSNPASSASSPASSGRTTPTAGLMLNPNPAIFHPTPPPSNGTSSASAAAAALSQPSPTSAARSHHTRTASLIGRTTTPSPAVHATSSTSSTLSPNRRSMTPAPVHQRSQSVAPGATSNSISRTPTITRSMTPGVSSASRAYGVSSPTPSSSASGNSHPNGSSVGIGTNAGGAIPPVPPLPIPISQSSQTIKSEGVERDSSALGSSPGRPPVPPKPRTLSQSIGAHLISPQRQGARTIVDDRDGYSTEKELQSKEKEKREKRRHERWLPNVLPNMLERISRPATSIN